MRVVAREASVFARVSPEHKLRLVEALQAEGEIVAMSGDGVNDAPALKRADVGVAMGQRGSDVAREVADLVLLDDDFATIVGAIEEGRSIFENLATFVRFTFATNVALVLLVVTGAIGAYVQDVRDAAGHILVPLTALQLLWINFLGDGPPALALALDRSPGVMQRPPRPAKTGLLDKPAVRFIAISGLVRGALGVGLLIAAPVLGATIAMTQTLVFLLESVGKLVSVYPARRVANRPHTNWALHGSIAFGIGLQVIALAVPAVRELLHLEMPTPQMLGVVAGLIAATWMAEELIARLAAPRPPKVEVRSPA
jgi:P-type Ca2+ transporter type 2C